MSDIKRRIGPFWKQLAFFVFCIAPVVAADPVCVPPLRKLGNVSISLGAAVKELGRGGFGVTNLVPLIETESGKPILDKDGKPVFVVVKTALANRDHYAENELAILRVVRPGFIMNLPKGVVAAMVDGIRDAKGKLHIVQPFFGDVTEVTPATRGTPATYRVTSTLLSAYANPDTPVPMERALVVRSLLDKVVALNDQGIVHNDIKPANVLVGTGKRPRVELIDFGVSGSNLTAGRFKPDSSIGSDGYRSLEQHFGVPMSNHRDAIAVSRVLLKIFPEQFNPTQKLILQAEAVTSTRQLRDLLDRAGQSEKAGLASLAKEWAAQFHRFDQIVARGGSQRDYALAARQVMILNLARLGQDAKPLVEQLRNQTIFREIVEEVNRWDRTNERMRRFVDETGDYLHEISQMMVRKQLPNSAPFSEAPSLAVFKSIRAGTPISREEIVTLKKSSEAFRDYVAAVEAKRREFPNLPRWFSKPVEPPLDPRVYHYERQASQRQLDEFRELLKPK